MGFDWKETVRSIAPTIGTAMGGPLGGMAAKALSDAVLGNEEVGEQELADAIAGAGPETIAAIKQAEMRFKKALDDNQVKLEAIAADDRASARQREIETDDRTQAYIAAAFVGGYFIVLFAIFFVDVPTSAQPLVQVLLGALTTILTAIANYYFGSSSGSSRKNKMLDGLLKKTPSPADAAIGAVADKVKGAIQ